MLKQELTGAGLLAGADFSGTNILGGGTTACWGFGAGVKTCWACDHSELLAGSCQPVLLCCAGLCRTYTSCYLGTDCMPGLVLQLNTSRLVNSNNEKGLSSVLQDAINNADRAPGWAVWK